MYEEILGGVVVFVAVYTLLRYLKKPRSTQFEQELEHILTSEEFKVKGKFED